LSQVRAFGDAALKTLLKSGASSSGPPPAHRDVDAETAEVLSTLQTMLPVQLSAGVSSAPNGPMQPKYSILESFLEFQAGLVADLIHSRNFRDTRPWHRCVASYMSLWLGEAQSIAFAEAVLAHFLAIDQVNIL